MVVIAWLALTHSLLQFLKRLRFIARRSNKIMIVLEPFDVIHRADINLSCQSRISCQPIYRRSQVSYSLRTGVGSLLWNLRHIAAGNPLIFSQTFPGYHRLAARRPRWARSA